MYIQNLFLYDELLEIERFATISKVFTQFVHFA